MISSLGKSYHQKTTLGKSSAMPFVPGSDFLANIFIMRTSSMTMDIFRRVDFASSKLPLAAADPAFFDEINSSIQNGSMREGHCLGLKLWFFAMRGIHFPVWCTESQFSGPRRAELLFLASALLLDFEISNNFREQVVLHLFGYLSSIMFHEDIHDHRKAGSMMVEISWALAKSLFRGNHKEAAIGEETDLYL